MSRSVFQQALVVVRRAARGSDRADVREEQRRTLLLRSRALCIVALFIYPFTILSYDALFFPHQLATGALIALIASSAAFVLYLALRQGLLDRHPEVALAILLGVVSNGAETAQLAVTGGPIESTFFFPYYLVFFGIATFFPAGLGIVLLTCLALPAGYVGLGWLSHSTADARFLSNVILLIDYAAITVIANRLVTTIFMSEAQSRLELEIANAQLRELDRMKSEFFANVSHELRTPLTLMLAPATSLLDGDPGPLTDAQRRLLLGMRRNASRLLGLINDLLLLAKLEAGGGQRRRVAVDLAHDVERTVVAMRGFGAKTGVELDFEAPDERLIWYGDPGHLDRIVMNLVSNACKFSPVSSRVTVTVAEDDDEFVISVRDSGVGIAASDLPKLFARFVQIDTGSTRKFEGTGIGLSIVKELVTIHGGDIDVVSAVGEGSTFTVRLPADVPAKHELPAKHERVDDEPSSETRSLPVVAEPAELRVAPAAPHDAATVMVVEDNEDLLSYLTQELGRGYRLRPHAISSEALVEAIADPPDLVLSDVMMPDLDGIQLTRRLRADPKTADLPVLLMSARDDVETKLDGFNAGVDDYVAKPFQLPELRARIDTHLRLQAQRRQLADALDKLKQSEATMLQNERMAVLGTVVAGVAHEINNPLHFIKGNLQLLGRELKKRPDAPSDQVVGIMTDLSRSLERLEFVAGELLRYGRSDTTPRTDVQLTEVVELAIAMVRGEATEVTFDNKLTAEHRAHANPQQMFQIALNLLQNAAQSEAAVVRIEADATAEANMIELRIQDDGVGIAEADLGKVLEPFYTTKPPGKGTGLGLPVVQKLVAEQGGSLRIASERGRGTTVSLLLPSIESPRA